MQEKVVPRRTSTNTDSGINDKAGQSDVTAHVPKKNAIEQVELQSKPPEDREIDLDEHMLETFQGVETPVDSLVENQTKVVHIKSNCHNPDLHVLENTSVQKLDHQQLEKFITKISAMSSTIILRSIDEGVSHAILDSHQSLREKIKQVKKRLLQKYMNKLQEKQNKWLEVF